MLRGRPTCQVEVLQRSLGSDRGVQLGAEPGDAVICAVDLTSGRSDVVRVGDGRPCVDVLDLRGGRGKIKVKDQTSRADAFHAAEGRRSPCLW